MRYRPDLDGIRALAVLAVFASHSSVAVFGGGWMGVDIFFVLSGYLITALFLGERAAGGSVSLRRFYARRALRLYPALLLTIAVVLVGVAFGALTAGVPAVVSAATYTTDLAFGLHWFDTGALSHTWSLSVEEQFYLLWPPALLLLLSRGRDPLRWAAGLAVVGWVWLAVDANAANATSNPDTYFLPWTRFPQLLAGCCLALVLVRRPLPAWLGSRLVGWFAAAALAMLLLVASRAPRVPHLGWEAPAVALLTVLLIGHLSQASGGGLRTALGWKPMAALGRRSYGFYLFHVPVLDLAARYASSRTVALAVALPVTLAAAVVSYRLVELPFLRLKRRFAPVTSQTSSLAVPAVAG